MLTEAEGEANAKGRKTKKGGGIRRKAHAVPLDPVAVVCFAEVDYMACCLTLSLESGHSSYTCYSQGTGETAYAVFSTRVVLFRRLGGHGVVVVVVVVVARADDVLGLVFLFFFPYSCLLFHVRLRSSFSCSPSPSPVCVCALLTSLCVSHLFFCFHYAFFVCVRVCETVLVSDMTATRFFWIL